MTALCELAQPLIIIEQQDDLNSELDSSSEEDAGAIEGEDAGERALKREEENAARLKKRKYRERLANPSIVKRAASHQVVKKSAEQPQTKKLKVQSTRPVSAKRQSARAHAVGIAAEVEKRLHEEATKKVSCLKIRAQSRAKSKVKIGKGFQI